MEACSSRGHKDLRWMDLCLEGACERVLGVPLEPIRGIGGGGGAARGVMGVMEGYQGGCLIG